MAYSSTQPAIKRAKKRQRTNAGGIEYPTIPNVPMDVIPGFVEAIRASAKVLQHHCHQPFLDHEAEYQKYNNSGAIIDNNNNNGNAHGTAQNDASTMIHDQLMNRVQTAADIARTSKEQAQWKRLEKQKLAIDSWIDSVKRFAYQTASSSSIQELQDQQGSLTSSSQSSNNNNNNNNTQQTNKKERPSVPYACFLYLWDLQQETPTKLQVRRAALYLSGILLRKSKDCRFHLQMGSNLADWIVQMATIPQQQQQQENDSSSISLALLQHEALRLLHKLHEQGYGKLYPKLAVAATRLRQQCPPLPTISSDEELLLRENGATITGSSSSTNDYTTTTTAASNILHRNMVDWRTIRDLALKYGNKELKRLQTRISKCHEALEIVVPRMGQQQDKKDPARKESSVEELQNCNEINKSQVHVENNTHDEGDDHEDDDDDIDWEDGDEELEEKEQELMASHPAHHLLAVDRTLAAMQSAAGGLQGGELEIDMRKTEKEQEDEEGMLGHDTNSEEAERKVKAKSTLAKLVKILREKHLPRLSLWLDGLANADNLVKSSAALVLLPGPSIQQRQKLIRELTAAKKSIFSILTSTFRLEEKNLTTSSSSTEQSSVENNEGNDGDSNRNRLMFGVVPRPSDTRRIIQPMLAARTSGGGGSEGRTALASAIARHQKRKRVSARSSRIQIKVKSR
ncbi:unnamed protein product [Cylindrotheca closterium]|uniref:Uncharacterized protein n=1 Tax=Cylindrotheca closterium TaxID=2856 RepID=A0AAD2CAP9_9STRA|nr:unnamed protein product [Cylindrotheca closterium]